MSDKQVSTSQVEGCIHYGAGYVSECCGAPIDPDVGICRSCKEHAEAIPDEEEQ